MDQNAERGEIEIIYSNFLQVGHNAVEFLLDFGRQFEDSRYQVLMRIVTNPAHAKEFADLLSRSIQEYEKRFGQIRHAGE